MGEKVLSYAIEVENLTVALNSTVVLDGLSFKLPHPSFLAIMGPNGAGKTTLIRVLLGFLKPVKGKVRVFGIDPVEHPSEVRALAGYLPQKERISFEIPMCVKDVVLMGRLLKKSPPRVPTREDIEAARDALRAVGLEELWNHCFRELSGGQQQRVLLARLLVAEPKIAFLDEPFAGVDVQTQQALTALLHKLVRERKVTIVLVTHDVNPIQEHTDYILLLNRKAIAFGHPTEVITSENLSKMYGAPIKVIQYGQYCYAITGDVHA